MHAGMVCAKCGPSTLSPVLLCVLQLSLPSPAALISSTCSGGAGIVGTAVGLEYLHYVQYASFVFTAISQYVVQKPVPIVE